MDKTRNLEAVASRLKQKEEEINKHLEALQGEVSSTGTDLKDYLKKNPWIGVAGSVVAGVVAGLILGKKSEKTRHKELVDTYIDRLAEIARQSGATEGEVGSILREALRETMPPVVYTQSQRKTSGLSGKLFGMAANMVLGYAQKSLLNFLEEKATASSNSDVENIADSQN